ncbi:MAG: type II secretion system F family protein, partial [Holophagales bacterium]|nr:type II secretion system F family protein [Holophagales bacterium]
MPAFVWKGKNKLGDMQEGVIVADTRDTAAKTLMRNNIKITSIQAQQAKSHGLFTKVKPKTLAIFTRQFSVMIDAGLPLVQCLEILGSQQEDIFFKIIIDEIRKDVEHGATLQAALSKHPKTFNDLYVNMVGAGEAGGILDIILQRLSVYIEKTVKLTGKVKGAMTYPISVITIAIIIVWIIMIKVIPVFSQIYEGLGSGLPLTTIVCINLSNILLNYGWIVTILILLLVFSYRQYYKTVIGRLQIDALYLKLPVLGNILRKVAIARFSRTLGTLI